jgi:hypothetical protein
VSTYVGQRKRATISLTVDDVATDGTVTVSLMAPDGTVTSPTVFDDTGSGAYHSDFTLDQEGRWYGRVASTGSVVAAAEFTIDVVASPFALPN